mgnify:CR=1 FL=1
MKLNKIVYHIKYHAMYETELRELWNILNECFIGLFFFVNNFMKEKYLMLLSILLNRDER